MAVQGLKLVARLCSPNFARLVARRSDDLVTLGVELNLRNLVLVALKQRNTRAREHVVHPGHAVRAGGGKFVAGAVETRIQDFIVVAAESLDALAGADVP